MNAWTNELFLAEKKSNTYTVSMSVARPVSPR